MKKKWSALYTILFCLPLILLQCSKEEAVEQEPEAVEEEEKDVISDPFMQLLMKKVLLKRLLGSFC